MYLFPCRLNAPYFSMCREHLKYLTKAVEFSHCKNTEPAASSLVFVLKINLIFSLRFTLVTYLLCNYSEYVSFFIYKKSRFKSILCPSEAFLPFQFTNAPNVCV